MDYDELKKKYEGSGEGKQSNKDILPKFVIALVVLVIVTPIIYLSYKSFMQSKTGHGRLPRRVLVHNAGRGNEGNNRIRQVQQP